MSAHGTTEKDLQSKKVDLLTSPGFKKYALSLLDRLHDIQKISAVLTSGESSIGDLTLVKKIESIKEKEFSTMQWLIKESFNKIGKIPDIIWDRGSIGKEPMMRLFGINSQEMILKLKKIIQLINI